jgi:hypothetical protein
MPSSNTPCDLKTMVVRALDAACTNATDENSNGCLSRSFADIKELLGLVFHCATFATRLYAEPFGEQCDVSDRVPFIWFSHVKFAHSPGMHR